MSLGTMSSCWYPAQPLSPELSVVVYSKYEATTSSLVQTLLTGGNCLKQNPPISTSKAH